MRLENARYKLGEETQKAKIGGEAKSSALEQWVEIEASPAGKTVTTLYPRTRF